MKIIYKLFLAGTLTTLCFNLEIQNCFAQKELSFTQDDRDRLIRLEATILQMEKRFDERFKQIDERFEQVDKRFDNQQVQINEINNTLQWQFGTLVGAMLVFLVSVIGFILWDRRTFIKPFEIRVTDVESLIQKNKIKIEDILLMLKALAKEDANVAKALKQFNFL
ncbi:MAG: hypothetical protein HY738_20460 [Bacteroidia bacterium]|nr:hypothetical protein [Bacteroidia bacterium]